ncbi:hypothetical protein D9M72_623380 [compost metagenome]
MFGAQAGAFVHLRFLDLDDQLGGVEHLGGVAGDARTGLAVVVVAETDGGAGVVLHPDLMAESAEFRHRVRRQADAVFVDLDLPGDTDTHGTPPQTILVSFSLENRSRRHT